MKAPRTDKTKNGQADQPQRAVESGARLRCSAFRQLKCASLLALVFTASYYFSYWLRYEGQLGPEEMRKLSSTVACVVLIKLILFGWFRVYQAWGRFVTFEDLVVLIQASISSLLITVLVDRFFLPRNLIPSSVFVLDCGTTIALVGGTRAAFRAIQERNWFPFVTGSKVSVFIVGANNAGLALLRTITHNKELGYHVAGFLDDDIARHGERIGGVPVLGTVEQTCRLADRHGVGEVLITAGSLPGKQVRRLVDEAQRYSVHVKVLPSHEQLINGSVSIHPRSVSINDLLRREPVQLDMGSIRGWLDNQVLLVTGSAGSIGSEICRQLLQFSPRKIVLVDRSENGQFFLERELRVLAPNVELEICIADVLDESCMRGILEQHRPGVIIHAAAYKHVPLMENHPREAVKNIVTATKRLADLAMATGVGSFVMISTDKAINPTSVMGACKRVAELYIQSLAEISSCRFVTVRFGNVLDSAGSVVPVFRRQIAEGGPVTITDSRMQRYFMTIPEAARLVIQAGVIGGSGEILLLDMGEPIRIVDLAADMIRLSGLKVGEDIEIDVVGMRPGEKLFEELHASGEKHLPTPHPKIVVADRERRNPETVAASVTQLESLTHNQGDQIVGELHSILPEYQVPKRRVAARKRSAA